MDAQLKKKWIKALRSGKYQQGSGALCENGRYCCLGVLAEVAGAKFKTGSVFKGSLPFVGSDPVFSRNENGHATGWLAGGVFGLPRQTQFELSAMNDGGKRFPDIADYVEAAIPADPT